MIIENDKITKNYKLSKILHIFIILNDELINIKKFKDIKMFFKKYGQGIYYLNSHHPTYHNIPDEIKPSALRAIKLANKLKITGLRVLSERELEQFDRDLVNMGL